MSTEYSYIETPISSDNTNNSFFLFTNLIGVMLFTRFLYILAIKIEHMSEVDFDTFTNKYMSNLSYISYLGNAFKTIIINTDTFIQSIVFSNDINNNALDNDLSNDVDVLANPPALVKYENKYLERYRNLEDIELSAEKLDSLKTSILMETTPLGNVIMFYDNSRASFVFYSDSTIPYRYLETVGRKYVIYNNCKKIFVDMEVEISEAERLTKESSDSSSSSSSSGGGSGGGGSGGGGSGGGGSSGGGNSISADVIDGTRENVDATESSDKNVGIGAKKNVFAKLKKYNNDTMKSVVASGSAKSGPLTRSAAKNTTQSTSSSIIKEHANRYSYEGKLVNFSFLKKVDRKVVDKNYALSFADFKKLGKTK